MTKYPIIPITDHPLTGAKRGIRLKQLAYIDFDIYEARAIWEEIAFDKEGNPIISEIVPRRLITSNLSNTTIVNQYGTVIDETYIKSITPIAEESEEEYQAKINEILIAEQAKGFPEFDFYVGSVLNMQAIGQSIAILDSFKRFDRA